MAKIKFTFTFEEREGFSEDELKNEFVRLLGEIDAKLSKFEYTHNSANSSPEMPMFSRKLSECICEVETEQYPVRTSISFKEVMGTLNQVEQEYPRFKIYNTHFDD